MLTITCLGREKLISFPARLLGGYPTRLNQSLSYVSEPSLSFPIQIPPPPSTVAFCLACARLLQKPFLFVLSLSLSFPSAPLFCSVFYVCLSRVQLLRAHHDESVALDDFAAFTILGYEWAVQPPRGSRDAVAHGMYILECLCSVCLFLSVAAAAATAAAAAATPTR